MKTTRSIMLLIATTALVAGTAADAQRARVRTTNGAATAGKTPNGSVYASGRGAKKNADGSVTAASGGAVYGANGRSGVRASTTTANPDGSGTRTGGFTATGANGSASSQGSATRNADGTYTGSRATTATGTGGTTYKGSTTIDPATGKPVTSYSCTDASGASISCPTPQ